MKYLKIENNGELDIRLVALMGGTTKASNKFKIGQFGTGLKYTLAYLFRSNISFKIFSGESEVQIRTEKETIKEVPFEIICINDHRTSITTQMGSDWSAWMIIRELWCNALDEGEALKEVTNETPEIKGTAGKTTFYIQLTTEIKQVLDTWESYFIHNKKPLWENSEYAIYPGDGILKLYKQGVLIYQHPQTKSLFNYDIKSASINELREFKGVPSLEILRALSEPNEHVITYFLKNVTKDHYEGSDLDYDWYHTWGEVWKQTLGEAKIIHQEAKEKLSEAGRHYDYQNVIELPKKIYTSLTKAFEGVGVLRMVDNNTEFYEAQDERVIKRVADAITILQKCNYKAGEGVKLIYGIFAEKEKIASVNISKKEILISEACLQISMLELVQQLIKQNEIIVTGLEGEKLTNHFLNMFIKTTLEENDIVL